MANVTGGAGRRITAVVRVAATYTGTVVGAGFASGQEVFQFFGLYGREAPWGILLAGALLALFGYGVLRVGHQVQARSHLDILRAVAPPRLVLPLDGLITLFLFGGLAAMAAGAGAVAREHLGLPALVGSFLLVAASATTVLLGIGSVVRAIAGVAPLLVGSILLVSLSHLAAHPNVAPGPPPGQALFPYWPLAALTYGSYNLVLSVAVLGPLGRVSPRGALLPGAVLGAVALAGCALAIQRTLISLDASLLSRTEVPMLAAAQRLTPTLGIFYAWVLLAEVYTTAVGNLFGMASRLQTAAGPAEPASGAAAGRSWVRFTVGTGLVAWLGAQLGFALLVRNLYALMGLAGFLLLFSLLRHGVKDRGLH